MNQFLLTVTGAGASFLLCLVGYWIGRFYTLKFREETHAWAFLVAGVLGAAGVLVRLVPAAPLPASEVPLFLGGLLVVYASIRLWYVMLGPRE